VKFGLVTGENRGNNKDLLFDPAVVREDPYFWLRDDTRKSEKVVDYLKQENEYCKTATQHIEGFSNEIYTEMKAHLKETDQEVPYAWGSMGWRYFTRTLEGKSYKLHCRTKSESVLEEDLQGDNIEVVLDENEVAEGKSYCDVGAVSPSPSHNLLAYAVDSTGYETYKVFLKDLESKELISEEVIEETTGDIEWGLEDSLIFYSKQDKAHRPYQLWVRVRGGSGPDQMLFQEDDERFWLGTWKSRSGKILFLGARSKETTEVHMINLQDLHASIQGNKNTDIKAFLKVVSAREQGVIYKVDHMESLDHLIFLSNYNGKQEFTLCASPLDKPSKENWYEMESFQYDPSKYLLGAYCFKDYLVLSGREDGLTRIWILHLSRDSQTGKVDVAKAQRVEFEEEAYEVNFSSRNKIFDTDSFRVIYSSMVTPDSTLVVDSKSGGNKVIKVEAVPGYDASKYATLRLEAPGRDGTMIPLSIVFKKEEGAEGDIRSQFEGKKRPTYLYGYGSYGANMDPSFGMSRLPLLDRGMAYVIAHIRGGSELGRRWYQSEGKYLTKCNTFDDFIDSAKFLRSSGIASKIAIEGRSAGGLLIGASMNRAPPGLFDVAVAGVPFVDVMTTMCDPSIPLTVIEWEEWGNPNESKYHDYILSYSPIDNVSATSCSEAGKEQCGVKDYPALLITAGLHDPRVAYWEPAKWIATMRHVLSESESPSSDSEQPLLLLKTDLTSGHFSASDRYKWLKERSFDYAFVLSQLGLHSPRL
jgi:oligopeptidase B